MCPSDQLTWARDHCPVLQSFQREFEDTQPLSGYTIGVATHLEAKSGVLLETLHKAGAMVHFTASEPKSTQGAVVENLESIEGLQAFAWECMTDAEFEN